MMALMLAEGRSPSGKGLNTLEELLGDGVVNEKICAQLETQLIKAGKVSVFKALNSAKKTLRH
jgi:hypothetical protein